MRQALIRFGLAVVTKVSRNAVALQKNEGNVGALLLLCMKLLALLTR